jgi:hypothetical protein
MAKECDTGRYVADIDTVTAVTAVIAGLVPATPMIRHAAPP